MERFKVDADKAVRVESDILMGTVTKIFEKMGVPIEDSRLAANVLVTADLRGVDTHGVSNMLRTYVSNYNSGEINPTPSWKVLRETPSTANIDSDAGHGIIIVPKAMEIAIQKAKDVGIGMVTIKNARHLGMASYHAMMALKHDMIGMCMTSCPPSVLPTFGAEPLLGTNPIALAAPADKEPPFVFDAAMSSIAGNKIGLATRLGNNLLPGWVADESGNPIMEETAPTESGQDNRLSRRLLPVGSTREVGSHKGYGLMAVVDILGGILSGGGYGANPGRPNFGHVVAAYSVEAFMDTKEFKRTMDEWLSMLKNSKPSEGHDRVLYAGLSESETEAERRVKGIPLHPEVMDWFTDICGELSIPFKLRDS